MWSCNNYKHYSIGIEPDNISKKIQKGKKSVVPMLARVGLKTLVDLGVIDPITEKKYKKEIAMEKS